MDGSHFDTLTRSLSTAGSRRRALGGLVAGALGLIGWPGGEDAAAHDLKAKCKKKSGEAKKKCLKKAKKHAAAHDRETSPPPPPTCSDNVKNGSESDVDCGGSCPRCGKGQHCTSLDDCATATCTASVCASCTGPRCDPDRTGICFCIGDSCVRGRSAQERPSTTGCVPNPCPAGTVCRQLAPGSVACHQLCAVTNLSVGDRCNRDAQCASGQCGCSGTAPNQICDCRTASCGGVGAVCDPSNLIRRDVDCCEGTCTGVLTAGGWACV
jgi:hypothetical protein